MSEINCVIQDRATPSGVIDQLRQRLRDDKLDNYWRLESCRGKFPFLQLPPELRNLVYSRVFGGNGKPGPRQLVFVARFGIEPLHTRGPEKLPVLIQSEGTSIGCSAQLIRTSKAIRSEAAGVLYSTVFKFRWLDLSQSDGVVLGALGEFLYVVGSNRRLLKHLQLEMLPIHFPVYGTHFPKVLELLSQEADCVTITLSRGIRWSFVNDLDSIRYWLSAGGLDFLRNGAATSKSESVRLLFSRCLRRIEEYCPPTKLNDREAALDYSGYNPQDMVPFA